MSERLKWFEIDKILISFTYGVVRYVGTWGGCRTEKTLDGKLFYSSEECFKKGKSIPKTKLSIYDVFKSLYGFTPIGDVWKYKNGRAVKGELEYFDVEIDNKKGKIYCKETYYRTCEDVYKFNDLTVVDKNEGHEPRDMAGGSGASPRRAMDASCGGTGIFLWIDRG